MYSYKKWCGLEMLFLVYMKIMKHSEKCKSDSLQGSQIKDFDEKEINKNDEITAL